MLVCFVTPEFVTEPINFDGGLSNYVYNASTGLIKLGHKPIVIVSSNITEIILHDNIEVHRVSWKAISENQAINLLHQSFILYQYIRNIADTYKINIIQYASYMGVGYYRIPNIPSVVRISSYNPLWVEYYGLTPTIDTNNINEIEVIAMKRADALFGPNKVIAETIYQNEKIEASIIESPMLDRKRTFDFSVFNEVQGKKYLLFFGTIGLLKGVKTIAEVLCNLFSAHSDCDFIFIGKDGGYNGQKMMNYVYENAKEFKHRIHYYDKMSHAKLFPFIINAYAIVLPSRIDNFPNTCIESMANSKVVIGTRNTGFDQLITDGVNGFLCERDNPADLLDVINKTINLEPNTLHSMERKAKERADLLKPEIVLDKLVMYYKETIDNFNPKSRPDELNKDLELLYSQLSDNHEKYLKLEQEFQKSNQLMKKMEAELLQCKQFNEKIRSNIAHRSILYISNYINIIKKSLKH